MVTMLGTLLLLLARSRAASIRIACVGDSVTRGTPYAPWPKTYPNQLQAMLGDAYEVDPSLGEGGATMAPYEPAVGDWYQNRESFDVLTQTQYDVVVVALGTNDAKLEFWPPKDHNNSSLYAEAAGQTYVANYREFVHIVRNTTGAKHVVVVVPVPYRGLFENARWDQWGADTSTLNENIPRLVRDMAAQDGLPVVDAQAAFWRAAESEQGVAALEPFYAPLDAIHPNELGLEVLARAVFEAVVALPGLEHRVPTPAPSAPPTATPAPSAAPTRKPTTPPEERIVLANRDLRSPECPGLLALEVGSPNCPADITLGRCDTPGLQVGEYCEADGECFTRDDLNNCLLGSDIYVVTEKALGYGDDDDAGAVVAAANAVLIITPVVCAFLVVGTMIAAVFYVKRERKRMVEEYGVHLIQGSSPATCASSKQRTTVPEV